MFPWEKLSKRYVESLHVAYYNCMWNKNYLKLKNDAFSICSLKRQPAFMTHSYWQLEESAVSQGSCCNHCWLQTHCFSCCHTSNTALCARHGPSTTWTLCCRLYWFSDCAAVRRNCRCRRSTNAISFPPSGLHTVFWLGGRWDTWKPEV